MMINLFKKNPKKSLEKKHMKLLEEARNLQRSGDIKSYARKMEEAQKIEKELSQINE